MFFLRFSCMVHSDNNIFTLRVSNMLVDVILKRPHQKLTLSDLAEISGFSVHYLSYFFKGHIGISPGRFIKDVYLEYAAIELLYTNEKVIIIALNAGYNSQQSFSRAFRNKFNCTPNEFRKFDIEYAKKNLKIFGGKIHLLKKTDLITY